MIRVTHETIYHFVCSNCLNWWSYAADCLARDVMTCPHCSMIQELKYEIK